MRGYASIVKLLIAARADVNQADSDGWTPLTMARIRKADPGIVSALERAGALEKVAMIDGRQLMTRSRLPRQKQQQKKRPSCCAMS